MLAYDPPKLLAYTFHPEFGEGAAEQPASRVTFTIEAHEGLVKLTLVHDELPDEETAIGLREGWSPILSSLKTMQETGKPLPQLQLFVEQGRATAKESGN